MAKSLGQRLDTVQAAIEAVESSQSYEMNGRKLTRADLATLYKQENSLINQIDMHGRDYIPGQNTRPIKMSANVRFS